MGVRRHAIEQARSRGNLIRAPSRTGSAAACSGQAWRSARRPRPAVGVVSLCNCARRRGGGARLSDAFTARMTLPAETRSAARPLRRARILEPQKLPLSDRVAAGKKHDGDTGACRRNEGQAQHAELSSSCVGRLYLPQSLDIWRQTPCKDCLGGQPGHAGGSSNIEAHAVWSSLTPNSRIKSAR